MHETLHLLFFIAWCRCQTIPLIVCVQYCCTIVRAPPGTRTRLYLDEDSVIRTGRRESQKRWPLSSKRDSVKKVLIFTALSLTRTISRSESLLANRPERYWNKTAFRNYKVIVISSPEAERWHLSKIWERFFLKNKKSYNFWGPTRHRVQ